MAAPPHAGRPLSIAGPMPLARCPIPLARCPIPPARCPMPLARCPIPPARCPTPPARCPTPPARRLLLAAISLLLRAPGAATGVSDVISMPRNVRLTSYNMDLVLRWDPPGGADGLTYETEYNTTVSGFRPACSESAALTCDLTDIPNAITVFGSYTGRVRARSGSQRSAWAESNQVTMDRSTVIGPPSLSLISNGAAIEVSIQDPKFRISELRTAYIFATYNVTYWKMGQQEKAVSIVNLEQNRLVLKELEPRVKFCVQVQIYTHMNLRPSMPSNVTCESTANEEESPWLAAVVTFAVMAMVVASVVAVVMNRKRLTNFLCPQETLHQHLKEYLLDTPAPSVALSMRDSHPPVEVFHEVSVVTRRKSVEDEPPPQAGAAHCSKQPDPSAEKDGEEEAERRAEGGISPGSHSY